MFPTFAFGGNSVLESQRVALRNHIFGVSATRLRTQVPQMFRPVEAHPGGVPRRAVCYNARSRRKILRHRNVERKLRFMENATKELSKKIDVNATCMNDLYAKQHLYVKGCMHDIDTTFESLSAKMDENEMKMKELSQKIDVNATSMKDLYAKQHVYVKEYMYDIDTTCESLSLSAKIDEDKKNRRDDFIDTFFDKLPWALLLLWMFITCLQIFLRVR